MHLTQHALARCTQRSLPADIVEAIYFFGRQQHAPGNVTRLILDRSSIALAADGNARRKSQLERYRDTYLIVGDEGRVVTASRCSRRFFN